MTPASPIFEWADWTFEPAEWRLTRADVGAVSLPNKSLELLALLLDRAPKLVSKDEILASVWSETVVEEGNIAFHIGMLRKTLDLREPSSCIETVRGRGYRFVTPVARRIVMRDAPLPERVQAVVSGIPAPAPSVAPAPAETSASAPAPAAPARSRRGLLFVPAAALLVIVAVLGWLSLANLDARVRGVVVLPATAADHTRVDGVADTIAARLSRETTLEARTAEWAAAAESAVEAGRRLQAETVLTASVDRSADPWRVTAQLTRVRDGERLWNWVFEVPASLPAVGAVIGGRVTLGLARHLGVLAPGASPDAVDPAAFDLFLQAREHWRQRTPPAVRQAITLYRRALAIDPGFARAYAGLADCYNITMSGLPVEERYAQAKENIERALMLDPDHAEALTSLAFFRYKFEWRWQESESLFKRAIEADPSYALAHHWYGEFLGLHRRYDEAIAALQRARALEPNSLAIEGDLVPPLLRAGRIAEARAVVERAAATNPTWHWVPRRMSEVLAAEGRERESLEEYWRALVLMGSSLDAVEELRSAYRAGGMQMVLRAEVARLHAAEEVSQGALLNATNLSRAYARLGDKTQALKWLTIAIDRREDAAVLMNTIPEYDSLRSEPEFLKLLERVGFPVK